MIVILEKLVWILAGLAVVGVIVFAAVGPIKSEISQETVMHEFYAKNPTRRPRANVAAPGPVQRQTFGQATETRRPQPAPVAPAQPAQPQPAAPRAPYDPGITIAGPVFLPEAMVQKYQHWEDVYDLSMTGYGEDITLPDGTTAFELREINEDSPLTTILDFRPRDIVISINGYAANKANGRQLYETLKNENTWNVLVLRNGQQQTMTFRR